MTTSPLFVPGEFHGCELYKIEPDLVIWLEDTYGPPGDQWFIHRSTVWFRNHLDHLMFLLKVH